MESDAGGVITPGFWKPGEFDVGDEACDEGVGRDCGECECIEDPGSSLGAMCEFDRRTWWCLFMIARCTVGGCTIFCGMCVGPR